MRTKRHRATRNFTGPQPLEKIRRACEWLATTQPSTTLWTSRDLAAFAHVRHTASVCTVAGFEFKRLRVHSLGKLKRLNHGGKRLPYCTVWWLPGPGVHKLPEALRTQRDIRHRYEYLWSERRASWLGVVARALRKPETSPKRARRSQQRC